MKMGITYRLFIAILAAACFVGRLHVLHRAVEHRAGSSPIRGHRGGGESRAPGGRPGLPLRGSMGTGISSMAILLTYF